MRKSYIQNILSALLVLSVASGNTVFAEPPVAYVDEDSFNFETVAEGTKVTHDFVIKNRGGDDLIVQKIIPTCGCTVMKANPEVIPSGKESILRVEFDSSGFSGVEVKKVKVFTNDPEHSVLTFTLRGIVAQEIEVSPHRISFDEVVRGEQPQRSFSIGIKEGSSHRIGQVSVHSPYLTLTPDEVTPTRYKGHITISSDAPLGELRERIAIALNETRRREVVTIPVYAKIKGEVEISPTVVSFGLITPQAPLERSIKVESAHGKDLLISKVTSDIQMVRITIREIEPKRRYVVRLALDPSLRDQGEDAVRGALQIATSLGSYTVSIFGAFPPPER